MIFAESFQCFQKLHPEWCESILERCARRARPNDDMAGLIGDTGLMGLRSLHITQSIVPQTRNARRQQQLLSSRSASPESSGGSDIDSLSSDVDSSSSILGFDEDRDFPVEILSDLFLGNAINSEDLEWLKKHNIEVSLVSHPHHLLSVCVYFIDL